MNVEKIFACIVLVISISSFGSEEEIHLKVTKTGQNSFLLQAEILFLREKAKEIKFFANNKEIPTEGPLATSVVYQGQEVGKEIGLSVAITTESGEYFEDYRVFGVDDEVVHDSIEVVDWFECLELENNGTKPYACMRDRFKVALAPNLLTKSLSRRAFKAKKEKDWVCIASTNKETVNRGSKYHIKLNTKGKFRAKDNSTTKSLLRRMGFRDWIPLFGPGDVGEREGELLTEKPRPLLLGGYAMGNFSPLGYGGDHFFYKTHLVFRIHPSGHLFIEGVGNPKDRVFFPSRLSVHMFFFAKEEYDRFANAVANSKDTDHKAVFYMECLTESDFNRLGRSLSDFE
jgi:hypothetical protein